MTNFIPTNPANETHGRNNHRIIIGVFHRTTNAGNDTALGEANYSHAHILKASYYKVVDAGGVIYQTTLASDTEWHSGQWDINQESLGYELTGVNGSALTPKQISALIADIRSDPATKSIANHRLSISEIRSKVVSGWCTHRDISTALVPGGHTDYISESEIKQILSGIYAH